ncbi:hypothetical protein [Verrucomicrobium spinosum]|uniref:hypothetical protein n=1 Tax=Verrucomicrobium spinosum TaxID=2736 RepID=UPI00094686AA|nr:hypothetical protein [Verrucomicrobium spinosum]
MRLPTLISVLTLSTLAHAGTPVESPSHSTPTKPDVNWLTGEGVNIGGFLFPHVHFQSVYGGTTADDVDHLGAGHHDPQRDGWTIQGFEFGTSLRAGEYLEGFGTYHLYYDRATDDWDGEFEEWFGKIKNLPGGLELRGGRYLSRFGLQNPVHMHGWDFVDSALVNGRFLGDDGLYTIGGEASWTLPVSWTSVLSVSVGVAPEHEHEHEGHEHAEEALFEAEGSLFSDTFVTANWTNQWNYNDFHQFRYGVSGAWGDNEFGRTSQVYGIHLEYLWRQNGLEAGGSYFRWRTERCTAASGPWQRLMSMNTSMRRKKATMLRRIMTTITKPPLVAPWMSSASTPPSPTASTAASSSVCAEIMSKESPQRGWMNDSV